MNAYVFYFLSVCSHFLQWNHVNGDEIKIYLGRECTWWWSLTVRFHHSVYVHFKFLHMHKEAIILHQWIKHYFREALWDLKGIWVAVSGFKICPSHLIKLCFTKVYYHFFNCISKELFSLEKKYIRALEFLSLYWEVCIERAGSANFEA
jgi:hypothetical protein